MKNGKHRGTPHPKRLKLGNITNTIASREMDSPMSRLHAVHNSVALVSGNIDSMMTGLNRGTLSEKLTVEEHNNFHRAMENVEATLKEWYQFFLQVEKRTSAPRSNLDVNNDNLIPIASGLLDMSDSPLVSGGRESQAGSGNNSGQLSNDRKMKQQATPASTNVRTVRFSSGTPTSASTSSSKVVRFSYQSPTVSSSRKVTFVNAHRTIRPTLPVPPHSVRVHGPSGSSSSSCLSTPSIVRTQVQTPVSDQLATPEAPEDIVNKYEWFYRSGDSDKTPRMSTSPPKTCALLGSTGEQEERSPVPDPVSPFRTPGLVLRSPLKGSPVSDLQGEDLTSKLSRMGI